MQKLSKLLLFLFLILSLSAIRYSLFPSAVSAQVPGLKFPCGDIADPEFHSLRPYQAAPCGDANKALFCSNNLIFTEGFNNFPECDSQAPSGEGPFLCNVNRYIKPHNLLVELDDSELPILGNTELVKNSQGGTETLDDAAKMNEYVSWYLSGVNNKAEYGDTKNTDNEIVNFSGPIQKLLPSVIQEAERIKTIENVTKIVNSDDDDTQEVEDPAPANHNQVVVCAKEGDGGLLGWAQDVLGIGKSNPVECYDGDVYRLAKEDNSWEGDLSWWNSGANGLATIVDSIASLLPLIPRGAIEESVGDHWNKRIPPLPWDKDNNGNVMSALKYQKYYNEWRGKTCVVIPVINKLICLDNIFVPNKYSDLYQYIPLSNTTDKKGAEYMYTDPEIKGSGQTEIEGQTYNNLRNAPLYFAHTQEDKDLSELLNKTYAPQGVKSEPLPETTEDNGGSGEDCRIVNVRANPGDNLFPGDADEMQVNGVEYTITQVPCVKKIEIIENCVTVAKRGRDCKYEEKITITCNAEVIITLKTKTKSPWVEEIWKTTVADSGSTFRKIFPKVEEGAPVSCIANMPAETNVTYTATNTLSGGGSEFSVKAPGGGQTDDPKLYFPFVGSIYEYFLKGIQTALRPKGYGEPITDGTLCQQPETGTGACKQWLFEKAKGGQFYYDKVIQAANATSCNGKKLNPFWAISIALNENGGLMTDDPKGLSKSHFGCNISQLQTIEDKISCMTNTLRNDCLAGKTVEQTLQEYGYSPGYNMGPLEVLMGGVGNPPYPPLFGSGFNTTQLTTNLLNANWVEYYKAKAPIFCPNSPTLEPSTN